jgi:hypothetical protein
MSKALGGGPPSLPVLHFITWQVRFLSYLPQLVSPLRRSKAEENTGSPIYDCLGPTSLIYPISLHNPGGD